MTDLVQRLREAKRIGPGWKTYEPNPLCQEAADEIERLRSQERDYRNLTQSLLDMGGGDPVGSPPTPK